MACEREIERMNVKDILEANYKKIEKKLLLKLHEADENGIENFLESKIGVQVNGKPDSHGEAILSHIGRYVGELTYRQVLEMIPEEKYRYFKLIE